MPVFGMNRGTVGFLMNDWRMDELAERIAAAKPSGRAPRHARDHRRGRDLHPCRDQRSVAAARNPPDGEDRDFGQRPGRLPELACDGVLFATPAGRPPIISPRMARSCRSQAKMLALTPISPFRPRRWSGAILPDDTAVCLTRPRPEKRPVSAVADQTEVRDVATVESARPRALADLAVRSRARARRAHRDGAIRHLILPREPCQRESPLSSRARPEGCSPVAQR